VRLFPRIIPSTAGTLLPFLGVLAVLGGGPACKGEDARTESTTAMPARDLDTVIKENAAELLAIPGVEGMYGSVAESGDPCIKVTVVRDTPELRDALPETLGGYPVVVVETGPIRPMGEEQE
jgi:hypothetical protein